MTHFIGQLQERDKSYQAREREILSLEGELERMATTNQKHLIEREDEIIKLSSEVAFLIEDLGEHATQVNKKFEILD